MKDTRIQKFIADCGIMSRRAAEKEIEQGRVTVNGEKATIGQKIDPRRDKVKVAGKTCRGSERKVYVMLNKPRGYVTTMSDEKGRKCIPELMEELSVRVYPCGRLDMDSEGLLLLTNDGEVAEKLMHPKNHLEKIYHVKVRTEVPQEVINRLMEPMEIDGYKLKPVTVALISKKDGATSLRFTLSEGRNRQIRKMCEKVGLDVVRLRRVAVGELNIGTLRPGQWRFLNYSETEYLKNL
ncbi:MAG: rRNA pseudouridine synthase [Ruminococcaceae bacterium]|nr:rRNA pseudouridine synthase [Oscillospiraceae bacterium]